MKQKWIAWLKRQEIIKRLMRHLRKKPKIVMLEDGDKIYNIDRIGKLGGNFCFDSSPIEKLYVKQKHVKIGKLDLDTLEENLKRQLELIAEYRADQTDSGNT